MRLKGIELVKDYREHPEKHMPVIIPNGQTPPQNEYGDANIGWYAGMLDEKRPFFAECWSAEHITTLTICVSAKGIENKTAEGLDRWFRDIGYYRQKEPGNNIPNVGKFTGKDNNEYFSINLTVGVDEEPSRIDGAPLYPWSVLNEYNSSTLKK